MSTPDSPDGSAPEGKPSAAVSAPPTDPAPFDPVEVLRGLGIMPHPISVRNAAKWSHILSEVRQGASELDACGSARVPWSTWMLWKKKGRGHKDHTPNGRPMQPYADLVRATRQVVAERNAEVRKARFANAVAGDPRSQEQFLTEGPAMQLATARSAEARLRVEMIRLQIEQQKVSLEQERLKLERMKQGGPDSTTGTFVNVVLLPALATGPGKARLVGPIDAPSLAAPDAAPTSEPDAPPALDAPTDRERRPDAAGDLDAKPRAADGFSWLQR